MVHVQPTVHCCFFSQWTYHFYVYASIFRELRTFLAFLAALFSFSRSTFEALVSSVLLFFGDDGKQYTSCSFPFFECDWIWSWVALSGVIVVTLGRQCVVRRWNWRTGSSFFIIPELINGATDWERTSEKNCQCELTWASGPLRSYKMPVYKPYLEFPGHRSGRSTFPSWFCKGHYFSLQLL